MILKDFNDLEENFGKKGEVLRKLNRILQDIDNVIVPETLVLSIAFFNNNIKNKLFNKNNKLLTNEQQSKIINCIRKKFKDKKVVIRSSASCEDSIFFTNSGQYESFLNLVSDEEILLAINQVFRSFISPNAMEYYKINNINYKNQAMAILIQEVAPVVKAGVMFTADPITGQNNPIIEFSNGLGENVVSGQKEVTTFKGEYNNITGILAKLLKIGGIIEYEMGVPQDIEWGIDANNNIYIFQSRPIIINKRNLDYMEKINVPSEHIKGEVISYGFAIGKIAFPQDNNNSKIIMQAGKLTAKDLKTIIENKAIILRTGGYLSHFANIIREFNKPSLLILKNEKIDYDSFYIIDGYNDVIYKLNYLNNDDKIIAYWNYLLDLINNGNKSYLNLIGIKKYKIHNKRKNLDLLSLRILKNKLYIVNKAKSIEMEFLSVKHLENFIQSCNMEEKNE